MANISPLPPLAPLRCPLCGRSNQCSVAAGLPPAECWCMGADIAPEALAAIPEDQRMQSCVCPSCARGLPAA